MDFIKYSFNEDEWNIYVIDDEDDTITELDAAAQVFHEEKEIYFRKKELRLNIVLHELWHVYFGYCYTSDAGLDMAQMEEVSSSLFADKGERILEKARDIYKKLKVVRDADKHKAKVVGE